MHKRSFGHAGYSPSLPQFLDILEPAQWRAFDAGNAQSGVGLQDCVASTTGFGDATGHRQARHSYSLRAWKIWLALDSARGQGQTLFENNHWWSFSFRQLTTAGGHQLRALRPMNAKEYVKH